MRYKLIIGISVITLLAFFKLAQASYFPFNDTGASSNLGIGTTSAFGGKLIVMGGNVGIGSLTPGSVLDIQGTTRTTGLQLNLNPASSYVLQSNSVGVGTWVPSTTLAVTSTVTPAGNSKAVQYNNASSLGGDETKFSIDANGNIGIGSHTPTNKLNIIDNSGGGEVPFKLQVSDNATDYWSISNLTGSAGYFLPGFITKSDGTGWSGVDYVPTNYFINISNPDTSTTQWPAMVFDSRNYANSAALSNRPLFGWASYLNLKMFIAASGNVGIGTFGSATNLPISKTPAARLHVWSESASGKGLIVTGAVSQTANLQEWQNYTSTALNVVDSQGNLGLGTSTPQGKFVVVSGNVGIGTWTAAGGNLIINGGGNVGIGTAWPGATLDINGTIRTASTGNSYFLSNVGIGSTAPGQILDVQGTTRTTGLQLSTTPSAGYVLVSGTTGIGTWMAPTTLPSSAVSSQWTTANTNDVYLPNNGNVGIGTSKTTTAGLTVLNGNVGIGTWVPFVLFHVKGGLVRFERAGQSFYFNPNHSLANTHAVLSSGLSSATSTTDLRLQSGSDDSSGGITIKSSGNVGIGTILPRQSISIGNWLDIYSGNYNTPNRSSIRGSTADNLFLNSYSSGATYINYDAGTGGIAISNGATAVMSVFDSSGNLGIGTFAGFSGASSLVNALSVTGGAAIGSAAYTNTATPSNGLIVSGNVGLGTSTPQTGLAIYGNVGIGTLTASTGALIVKGGNVGIGTALVPTTMALKGALSQIVVILSDAATVATDASLGNHFRVTLGGNRTLGNPTNVTDGQRVIWELIQDGTGTRTITLDSKFALGTDIASVTLTTTASKRDFLTAIYNVTADKWYVVGFVKGY